LLSLAPIVLAGPAGRTILVEAALIRFLAACPDAVQIIRAFEGGIAATAERGALDCHLAAIVETALAARAIGIEAALIVGPTTRACTAQAFGAFEDRRALPAERCAPLCTGAFSQQAEGREQQEEQCARRAQGQASLDHPASSSVREQASIMPQQGTDGVRSEWLCSQQ
jgi:hypothetical protein